MSASNTNLEKQKRRHMAPIIGISAALIVAFGMFLAYLAYTADTDEAAAPPPAQTEAPAEIQAPGTPTTPMTEPDAAPGTIEQAPAPIE